MSLFTTIATASVPVFGVLFTYFYRQQSENRLRADTYLKAIELMTIEKVPESERQYRREGVLTSLLEMGNVRLAYSLSESYYAKDHISPRLFIHIINRCLLEGDHETKRYAVSLLHRMKEKISQDSDENILYPPSVVPSWIYVGSFKYQKGLPITKKWNRRLKLSSISSDDKHSLRDTLIEILISKPESDWSDIVVNQVINTNYQIYKSDSKKEQRLAAILYMKPLLELRLNQDSTYSYMDPEGEKIVLSELMEMIDTKFPQIVDRSWLADQTGVLHSTFVTFQNLQKWCRSQSL